MHDIFICDLLNTPTLSQRPFQVIMKALHARNVFNSHGKER